MEERELDELAQRAMDACREYALAYRKHRERLPIVWVENNESGEFFAYTDSGPTEPIKILIGNS